MLDLQPIIRKVQRLRRRKGLNQQRFAEYLGVSLATITRWGRGGWDFTPSLAQLAKMAELFKTTVPELLTVDAPASALPLIPDTAPEAAETPSTPDTLADIVTYDETPQEAEPMPEPETEAVGIASQIVTNDELLSTPAPEAEPEAQAVNASSEIVTHDETPTTPEPADSTPPDEAPSPAAAPDIVTNDESPKEAEAAQVVTPDEKPKPWAALGISRAWYYKLRQQGRLDEYLKIRENQPDSQ